MNPKSDWIRLAFACVLAAWLPATASAQPLVYVAGDSTTSSSTRAAQLTVINSATGDVVRTLSLGEWPQSAGPSLWNPAVVAAPDGSRAYVTVGPDLVIVARSGRSIWIRRRSATGSTRLHGG